MSHSFQRSRHLARWSFLTFAVLLHVLSGCTRYNMSITTYLSHELPFPTADGSTKVAVVIGSDPDEPLLKAEVKRKIETLVRQHGFEVTSEEEASYILSAFFSIDSGNTGTGTLPVYQAGGTSTSYIYTNTGQWATATTHHPGSTSYVPYSYTYFMRFLGISVFEKQRWRASKQEDYSDAIVWRATTASTGDSDLRSAVDYLLVATFDYFGEDTGKRKRETIYKGDRRVRELREETSAPASKKR